MSFKSFLLAPQYASILLLKLNSPEEVEELHRVSRFGAATVWWCGSTDLSPGRKRTPLDV
jgi:hypothetical protein